RLAEKAIRGPFDSEATDANADGFAGIEPGTERDAAGRLHVLADALAAKQHRSPRQAAGDRRRRVVRRHQGWNGTALGPCKHVLDIAPETIDREAVAKQASAAATATGHAAAAAPTIGRRGAGVAVLPDR